jgi:NAD(P)-dependent dehydrogenase (short-subunit alcohol dehydrogenase family)
MGRLDGKVAVVTGGGSGIGRACCVRFAEEGADVVVADVNDDTGNETVELVQKAGGSGAYQRTDAASADDVGRVMAEAVKTFGGLDVVVTAAGISHAGYRSGDVDREIEWYAGRAADRGDPAKAFVNLSRDDWQAVLDVNLTGTLLAVQAAAREMIELGRPGSIITIASIAAKHPEAGPPPYVVSKAGVWMLTKHAARSFAGVGIRVNSIGPGYIETNMTAMFRAVPDARDRYLKDVPMGRMGTAQEVANAALFLASDESSYFTGEILHPDGGFYTE